jgi:UDP-2,4-diacetamido-2,4,6-trideoxy-beta-L-altropyranose hydrolase
MVMRVAIRVDASVRIGTGHVRRCLSLADALRRAGAEVAFVTRDLGADTGALIAAQGFRFTMLPAPRPDAANDLQASPAPHASWAQVPQDFDADETCAALADYRPRWMIVDHYAFDARWHELAARRLDTRLAVIDDLADRPLACQLVVDHNLHADHRAKYGNVLPAAARILGGPRYALLSEAFRDVGPFELRAAPRSIGIFLGGSDPWGLSSVALRACREFAKFTGVIEVVTTSTNPNLAALERDCRKLDARLLTNLADLADFFARHDLQIGAGGGAALERCRVGAPSIGLVCAMNQAQVIEHLASAGALRKASNEPDDMGNVIAELLASTPARRDLSAAARRLVDGRGASRVAVALAADEVTVRRARAEDAELVYAWRNDARTWRHFRHPGNIGHAEHLAWWRRTLDDSHRRLLIASCGDVAVGTLRFDIDDGVAEVSIYLDPDLTGLGLGARMLSVGQRWIAADMPRLTHLRAEILEANKSSATVFNSAGFVQVAPTQWRSEIRR